jgi:hypothetical protein
LNFTELTPVKLVPRIVTVVPTLPLVGLKLVIVGAAPVTLKSVALVAVPAGVVSVILPVVAPLGTTALTFPLSTNVKVAAVPLNFTELTPVKFVPWIATVVPTLPLAGLKLVIVGGAPVTLKLLGLVALPCGVFTTIGPVEAPPGTLTLILCPEAFTMKPGAFVPLKVTDVVPVKFVPWIATAVPTGPLLGSKLEMVGAPPAIAGDIVNMKRPAAIAADAPTRANDLAPIDLRLMDPPRVGR